MSESRLFQILYILLNKKTVTAPALAKQLEVSVRTIYRDIDMLSAAGIPVYTNQGKGGGIFIQDNFILNKLLLSEKEQNQILMALQGMKAIDPDKAGRVLLKLNTLFQSQKADWIEVDFSGWIQAKADEHIFDQLRNAIWDNHSIRFDYHNNKGETACRTADPYKLVFKSKDWYVYAFCWDKQEYRFFKLTRIRNMAVLAECFRPRNTPQGRLPYDLSEIGVTVDLTLRIDSSMAFRVYDEFPYDTIQNDDGSFTIHTQMPLGERLFSYLLSYGAMLEVVEPSHIRTEFLSRLEEMRKKYL